LHEGLRDHILHREPLLLIAEGDPGQLSIADRSLLLATFAERQLAGKISQQQIDHRALWMFADRRLASAIKAALAINDRADFEFQMLRLIDQGQISGCRDILRHAALRGGGRTYHRIVAIRALAAIGDTAGLEAVAADILADPNQLSASLAPSLACVLFPVALTVEQLLTVIGKTTPARQFQVEGFRDELSSWGSPPACRE
jgi:hypothetical protein